MATSDTAPSRRTFLSGLALAGVAPALAAVSGVPGVAEAAQKAAAGKPWTQEYWAQKSALKLNMLRKRASAPKTGEAPLPVLFLVHGSSLSSRTSFDLNVPGQSGYSMMDKFAGYGFDVWTMDFEGYGKSSPADGNSNIADGVASLKVACDLVARETGQQRSHFFGESSGALRAGAFAMVQPERVNRLVLGAFTYTGAGSPTLTERAKQVEFYRTHNLRPRDREMVRSIFTRDKPGTTDAAVAEAVANSEMGYGDSVPTGTYLDMTANLPVVDPARVKAPVLVVRGEYDGIATEEDLVDFFRKLPNGDRQLVVLPGVAHSLMVAVNREHFFHVTRAFLEMPTRRDVQKS